MKIGAKVNQPGRAEIYSCIGFSDSEIRTPLALKKFSIFFVALLKKKLEFLARGVLFSCQNKPYPY